MLTETQPLLKFIEAAKSQGASDEFLVALLRQNGWSEKRIYQAFGEWYQARIGSAVPSGGGRVEAAKDAFLYLLAFITLGIWTIQLGALLFAAIDRTFPNPVFHTGTEWIPLIAGELASIIVAFPLFLFVTSTILRSVRQQPERLESSVRKWLTYIALVITASTMICDVVAFLQYFLRGDLNIRFVLKVLVVLVIASGVFTYYFDSLRRSNVSSVRNRGFALAALAMAIFGVIVGFTQIGSPSVQRSASADARRLFDLSSLAEGLHSTWLTNRGQGFTLPATLQEMRANTYGGDTSILDPVNGRPYRYIPGQGTAYRLCAVFASPSPSDVVGQWSHQAGNTCFTLDASKNVESMPRPQ